MKYSILIPTYRRPESLAATLKSLFTLEPLEQIEQVMVHVTDSVELSVDDHCRWLMGKLRSRGVQVILREYFIGLPEAKNRALDACKGGWLLIVDDDVVLNEAYVQRLIHLASKGDKHGVMAVTGTLLTPFEAGYAEWSLTPQAKNLDRATMRQCMTVAEDGTIDWGDKVQAYRYPSAMTCCLGYFFGGAVLLKSVEGLRFDKFFGRIVYGEEIDYSLQIQAMNGLIIFAAGSECLHFPCPVGGSKPDTKEKLVEARQRNFNYILRKWKLSRAEAKGFEARSAEKTLEA